MFFEKVLLDILDNAKSVNNARETKDKYYNYVFYGCLLAYEDILKELGHCLDVKERMEDNYIYIDEIFFDGKQICCDGVTNEDNVNELLNISD